MEQLRERGEVVYVEYMYYGSTIVEECADLEEAYAVARSKVDDAGIAQRVYGKGFSHENFEWED